MSMTTETFVWRTNNKAYRSQVKKGGNTLVTTSISYDYSVALLTDRKVMFVHSGRSQFESDAIAAARYERGRAEQKVMLAHLLHNEP